MKKTLSMRIVELDRKIDSAADILRGMKIGSPEWMKQNDKLFNLVAKRERIIAQNAPASPQVAI